ncbi:TrmH family RNA methyltransferase [Pontimicrobium aquaticum]|uniref:RNA methyltransferase n=1 Tax=Pontimicrobium aquaticum TaxID=2565367 RepID=A0A4U0EWV2_9FLAO|nr:RNA methyltransferase [Pontimicrobium aquaticum]TJY36481.1 RNA methyltransferase [Pontimicrobium aquaticum]
MLSKNQIKLITSLKLKKYRQQHKLFVAEGKKTINELLQSNLELEQLYTTSLEFDVLNNLITQISDSELKKISFLKTPNTALAVFKIPEEQPIDFKNLIVALDNVRDPGNLGTIIRLCDWFGVKDLLCNLETVDCYNPKVIQATMGSITRVNVSYVDLKEVLKNANTDIFGAFMDGENVYNTELPNLGIVVLGNEANGISNLIEKCVTKRVSIPRFGEQQMAESLNVANATAILLSEFKRR